MTNVNQQSSVGTTQKTKGVSAFIDWISVTHKTKGDCPLPDSLPKESIRTNGQNGYTHAKKYLTGVIEMVNPNRPDMGTHIMYSGKTLQLIQERYGVTRDEILHFHTNISGRIARIDYAIDLRGYNLNIDGLWEQLESGQATTKSSHSRIQSGNDKGYTLYVGSRKKRKKLLRVYDKAKELGNFVDDYKRIELECHSDSARNSASLYINSGFSPQTITSMVRAFCDFPLSNVWSTVLNTEPLKIPTGDKSIGNTEKWLLEQVAPAFARVLVTNPEFYEIFKNQVEYEYNDFIANQLPAQ